MSLFQVSLRTGIFFREYAELVLACSALQLVFFFTGEFLYFDDSNWDFRRHMNIRLSDIEFHPQAKRD